MSDEQNCPGEALGDAGHAIWHAAQEAAFAAVMDVFGPAWARDPASPPHSPEEVERLRHAYALPAISGALLGLMQAAWVTAPRGSTVEELVAHIQRNAPLLSLPAVELAPAGDFWARANAHVLAAMRFPGGIN